MTKEQFIQKYGNRKTKEAAGALHTFLAGYTIDNHYELEAKIIEFGNKSVTESIEHLGHLLEFTD
jgi:hypothetical protein